MSRYSRPVIFATAAAGLQMPPAIYLITFAIPATYYIQILRGVVCVGQISSTWPRPSRAWSFLAS
jgi:hypothetical protein